MSERLHNRKGLLLTSRSWRRVKEDYLHHFSLPRLDLLVWVLITKLAPTYYRKLDVMLSDIGRFCELPKWRRDFKSEWNKARKTPITMPLNEKYRPDVKRFVCTCLQFVVSRFLLCKHLVQQFEPVDPKFFLEVMRNRCVPFWSHPSLKPLSSAKDAGPTLPDVTESDIDVYSRRNTARIECEASNLESDDDDDDELVDTWENRGNVDKNGCRELMENNIHLIRSFCDGLEYQLQFQDPRFLMTMERESARFLKLARDCLSRERRLNSSRAASPATWEKSTANALFYRARPSHDHNT